MEYIKKLYNTDSVPLKFDKNKHRLYEINGIKIDYQDIAIISEMKKLKVRCTSNKFKNYNDYIYMGNPISDEISSRAADILDKYRDELDDIIVVDTINNVNAFYSN